MRFALLFVSLLCLAAAPVVWAQRTVSSEKPIVLRLPLYKPVSLQLPEPILKISAIELPELYTIDFMGVYVYLTAKSLEVDHRIFLIGQSGQQYQVDFTLGTPPDTVVKVVRPALESPAKASPFGLASWFRALRLQKPIPGQAVAPVPAPVSSDARVAVLSATAVSRGAQVGMVVHLQNTTEILVTIDGRLKESAPVPRDDRVLLEQWAWPPKMTVETLACDEPMVAPGQWVLHPGQTTRLYVLFEKR